MNQKSVRKRLTIYGTGKYGRITAPVKTGKYGAVYGRKYPVFLSFTTVNEAVTISVLTDLGLCLAQVAHGLVKNESEVYFSYVRDVDGFVGFTMIVAGTYMEESYYRLFNVPIMKTLNIFIGAMDCTLCFSFARKYFHIDLEISSNGLYDIYSLTQN
ncbi:unnamed protein product [Rotaria magnacalcarata]|uniref:Uncharacterized protein n=1 Tax=Rotaria magnacalcarata TaxID=392030 RepID=A0A8S2N9K8_9BILA|nr:unnamed protein product [Rotaria magnacalcarata]